MSIASTRLIPTIEALIARCLTEPDLLESAIENPTAFSGQVEATLRQEAQQFNFRKLQSFSAFITKVQHNYLWEYFPATRQLLWRLGIEHDVFGEYKRTQLLPLSGAPDRIMRVRRFCEFLEKYSAESRQWMLRCIFTHERLLWELSTFTSPPIVAEANTVSTTWNWAKFRRSVPAIAPNVRIVSFDHDPLRVIALLSAKQAELPRVRRKPITLLYAFGTDSNVRTFTLDPISELVCLAVTGRDSVSKLTTRIRKASSGEVRPSVLRPVFERAVDLGFMYWENCP